MNRLTKKIDLQEFGSAYIISSASINEIPNKFLDKDYVGEAPNKLGKLEDLEEEIGVNDLIHFLKWCVKYRDNFINRSFDSLVAFYKKAMCETEKDRSE